MPLFPSAIPSVVSQALSLTATGGRTDGGPGLARPDRPASGWKAQPTTDGRTGRAGPHRTERLTYLGGWAGSGSPRPIMMDVAIPALHRVGLPLILGFRRSDIDRSTPHDSMKPGQPPWARITTPDRLMKERTPTRLPDPGRIGFVLLKSTPRPPFRRRNPSNAYEGKMKIGFVRAISGCLEPSDSRPAWRCTHLDLVAGNKALIQQASAFRLPTTHAASPAPRFWRPFRAPSWMHRHPGRDGFLTVVQIAKERPTGPTSDIDAGCAVLFPPFFWNSWFFLVRLGRLGGRADGGRRAEAAGSARVGRLRLRR